HSSHLCPHMLPHLASICPFSFSRAGAPRYVHSFPTRRSSDLPSMSGGRIARLGLSRMSSVFGLKVRPSTAIVLPSTDPPHAATRSEEHTSELQSRENLVCRLLLEKKKFLDTTGY